MVEGQGPTSSWICHNARSLAMGQKALSLSKSSTVQQGPLCAGERVREQTHGPRLASVDAYHGDPDVLPEVREARPEVGEQGWELLLFPWRSAGAQAHCQVSNTVPLVKAVWVK